MLSWRPRWRWGGFSSRGGRNEQQDRWGVFHTPSQEGMLVVVADGMGGHRDGALAAQAVVDTAACLVREQPELLSQEPHEALYLLCQQAQTAVADISRSAHTTLVALWLEGDQASWLHIGDSRLYLFRAGRRLLRTRDHSSAQMLVDLGEINEAEMAAHPAQNRLYRSLGNNEAPKPELGGEELLAGDLLVMCSDGVWSHINDSEFCVAATASVNELDKAATGLVKRAVQRGGQQADNATLIIVRYSGSLLHSWLRR